MRNILIVGYGQIGKAIHGLYEKLDETFEIYRIDTREEAQQIPDNIEIMHICFGYDEKFSRHAIQYIEKHKPELTIIHSTVAPLTTQIIYDNTKADIVHSPVMGVHPHLTESIQRFRKIIGPCTVYAGEKAAGHYNELGIECRIYRKPEESEMAKLLDTTYYAWNIYYMQKVHDLCEEYHLDFDKVYTETNNIYNNGYREMNKLHVLRPVLQYMGPGIGGHCLYPNALILEQNEMLKDVAKKIIEMGEKKE